MSWNVCVHGTDFHRLWICVTIWLNDTICVIPISGLLLCSHSNVRIILVFFHEKYIWILLIRSNGYFSIYFLIKHCWVTTNREKRIYFELNTILEADKTFLISSINKIWRLGKFSIFGSLSFRRVSKEEDYQKFETLF